jgi:hypothetical protein
MQRETERFELNQRTMDAMLGAAFVAMVSMACGGSMAGSNVPDRDVAGRAKLETVGGPKSETVGGTKAESESEEDGGGDTARASISQALVSGGLFDVGVIPSTPSCPAGSEPIQIHMDDEDSNNANSRWGWLGATINDTNTTFRFCRVPGDRFLPLAQTNATVNHYAVLKLGTYCPPFSQEFARYFDNEDSSNANWYTGNVYPNSVGGNTLLRFCLFRYGSTTMSSFPALEGLSYSVFASGYFKPPVNALLPLAYGHIHIDDEDSGNANGYLADSSIMYEAQLIVSGGTNTDIGFARVR